MGAGDGDLVADAVGGGVAVVVGVGSVMTSVSSGVTAGADPHAATKALSNVNDQVRIFPLPPQETLAGRPA
jgi:hypothetical protein